MKKREKSKCVYPLNELIKLDDNSKLDVSKLHRAHRICYYPEIKSVIIKSSYLTVKCDDTLSTHGNFDVLSRADAPLRYPTKFENTLVGNEYDGKRIMGACLQLSPTEMLFCRKHGAVATYIRSLIRAEMEKENFKTDELQDTI